MYKNIGKKIKFLAIVICLLGILSTVVYIYVMLKTAAPSKESIPGILRNRFVQLGIGLLASYLGSWLLYGFGELVDNASDILRIVDNIEWDLTHPNKLGKKEEENSDTQQNADYR